MERLEIKNALRKCGHTEDYSARTGGTMETLKRYAAATPCTKCNQDAIKELRRIEGVAIAKVRAIMEAKGFMNCEYQSENDGKSVEVRIWIQNIDNL